MVSTPECSNIAPASLDTRLIAGLVGCARPSTASYIRELLFQHLTAEPADSPDEIQFLAQTISNLRQILHLESGGDLAADKALQDAAAIFVNFEVGIAGLRAESRKRMSR